MLGIELKWASCSLTHRPTHGQGTLYSKLPSCSLTQRPTHGQGTLYSIWPSCSLTYRPTHGQGTLYSIYKIVSLLSPAWLHARLDQMFADGCCNSSFKMALIITRHTWPVGFKQEFCISFSTISDKNCIFCQRALRAVRNICWKVQLYTLASAIYWCNSPERAESSSTVETILKGACSEVVVPL